MKGKPMKTKSESAKGKRRPVLKREQRPAPKRDSVEIYVKVIKNDESKEHSVQDIASYRRCSVGHVARQPFVREYRQKWRSKYLSVGERVKKRLAKGDYNGHEIAKLEGISAASVVYGSLEWQNKQNEKRLAEGKEIFQYKNPSGKPSAKIVEAVKTSIDKLAKAGRKVTGQEIVDDTGYSVHTVWKTKALGEHNASIRKIVEKMIASVLFADERNPQSNLSGKRYELKQVATIVQCTVNIVCRSPSWQKYQKHFALVGERIQNACQTLQALGEVNPTNERVAGLAECCEGNLWRYDEWNERHELYPALFPTVAERIEKAEQELKAEGIKKPTHRQIAEKAGLHVETVGRLKRQQCCDPLVVPVAERIEKAEQELKAEGIKKPTYKQIAEKAGLHKDTVGRLKRKQRSALPVKSAHAEPQRVIMARKKEKPEDDTGKTTFKAIMVEEKDRIYPPEEMILKEVTPPCGKRTVKT